MKTTVWLFLSLIGLCSAINWNNITKEELNALSPSAFGNITAEELGSIPPPSCEGLQKEQMENIPGLSASGFTKDQIAKFNRSRNGGCRGLTRDHMGNITSEAYAGFTRDCLSEINSVSFAGISKEQVANWTPDACSVILKEQMMNLPGLSASGFTKDQITGLAALTGILGCSGLLRDHMGNITSEAYAGFIAECVRNIIGSSISGIAPNKVKSLTGDACSGFRRTHVPFIRNDSLVEFSLEQLRHFSPQAVSGFLPFQLVNLALHWNASFVDLYDNSHWFEYSLESKVAFKEFIFESIEPTKSLPPVNDIPSLTWLQLALVKSSPTPKFTVEEVKALNETTIGGLRKDFVPLLSFDVIAAISSLQATGLTGDITFAMNSSQLIAFPPNVFGSLSLNALYGIDPLNVPSLTPQQIASLPENVYRLMPCEMIEKFTTAQTSAMDEDQRSVWGTRFNYCSPFPPTSTGSSTDTGDGLMEVVIVLCIGGVVIVATISVGVFVSVYKKRRARSEYQSLQ